MKKISFLFLFSGCLFLFGCSAVNQTIHIDGKYTPTECRLLGGISASVFGNGLLSVEVDTGQKCLSSGNCTIKFSCPTGKKEIGMLDLSGDIEGGLCCR